MKRISDILPAANALLALAPEELAGYVLEHLHSLSDDLWHRHNYTQPHMLAAYLQEYQDRIANALMEAWVWLEQEGLLVPRPGQLDDFRNISRTGQELKTNLDVENYRKNKLLPLVATNVPDMTPQENSKKKKYNYKTNYVLTFLHRDELQRSHIVQIDNGKEFGIPYSCSVLLLLMAITLKENKEGWVTIERIKKEGLINEEGKKIAGRLYSWVFKLRAFFNLKVEHPNFFIELAKGHCKYRISTDPTNLKGQNLQWLKKEYKMILKEQKTRKKQAGRRG